MPCTIDIENTFESLHAYVELDGNLPINADDDATMYVRDHARPEFHKALGIDPTEYDYTVFRIASDISRQCFPVVLDTDNPRFRESLERLRQINDAMGAANAQGGIAGKLRKLGLSAAVALTFAKLFVMRAKTNELPAISRLEPA